MQRFGLSISQNSRKPFKRCTSDSGTGWGVCIGTSLKAEVYPSSTPNCSSPTTEKENSFYTQETGSYPTLDFILLYIVGNRLETNFGERIRSTKERRIERKSNLFINGNPKGFIFLHTYDTQYTYA